MPMNKVQAGDSAGLRRLRTRIHAKGTLGVREPWAQVAPAPKQIERFPGFSLSTSELRRNHKTRSAGMLGVARSSEENGRFGPRGGRARIAHISGEEFGIDACGVGGRVVVNLRRSNVWRDETVVIRVGVGGNSR